jgi:hypothetical protein
MTDAYGYAETPQQGPYWIGDKPYQDAIVAAPEGTWSSAIIFLVSPRGTHRPLDTVLEDGVAIATWPNDGFPDAGLYSLESAFTADDGMREHGEPVPIVVQSSQDGWHTVQSASVDWPDSAQVQPHVLYQLLEVARQAVSAYAVPSELLEQPSANFRMAQLLHARSLWNVSKSSTGSVVGSEAGYTIAIRPLDSTVRALIRPPRAVPVFG